jgi:hypothetical protein
MKKWYKILFVTYVNVHVITAEREFSGRTQKTKETKTTVSSCFIEIDWQKKGLL